MTSLDTLTDDRLDASLRRLDPASPVLSATEQHHADDLKARILMTAPDANILGRPPAPGDGLPVPTPQRRRRLTLAGGAVVAVSAALLAAPLFGDEERRPAAWSATPTALPGDDARELGEDCLATAERLHTDSNENRGPEELVFPPDGSFEPEQRRSMKLVVGERRGPFDLIVLGNAAGYELECLSYDPDDPVVSGGTYPLVAPSPTSVSVSGSAMGSPRTKDGRPGSDFLSVALGRVGEQVSGVTVSTPSREVTASVSNGWFVASWPEWVDRPNDPFKDVTITLTLADGTRTSPEAFASFPQRDVPPELLEPTPSSS